jgi:hypothetical protein
MGPGGQCLRLSVLRDGGEFERPPAGRYAIVSAPHDEYQCCDASQGVIDAIMARGIHAARHGADAGLAVVAEKQGNLPRPLLDGRAHPAAHQHRPRPGPWICGRTGEHQGPYPAGGLGRGVHDDLAAGRMPVQDRFLMSEFIKVREQQVGQFRGRPGDLRSARRPNPGSRTTVERSGSRFKMRFESSRDSPSPGTPVRPAWSSIYELRHDSGMRERPDRRSPSGRAGRQGHDRRISVFGVVIGSSA